MKTRWTISRYEALVCAALALLAAALVGILLNLAFSVPLVA